MDRIIGNDPVQNWIRQDPKIVKVKVTPGMKPYTMTVFRQDDLTPQQWTEAAQMLYSNFGIIFVDKESDPITTKEPVAVDFPGDTRPMFEVTVRPIAEKIIDSELS